MMDDGPIVSHIRAIFENDFDAVAIKVHNGSIEGTVCVSSRRRRSIGTASGGQRSSIKVSNGRAARGGESDMCSSGFHAVVSI